MTAKLPDELAAGPIALRRWRAEHIDPLMELVDGSFPELQAWMTWAQEMPTRDAEMEMLRTAYASFELGSEFGYGIFEPDGTMVGTCGLHRGEPAVCSIGYFVRTDRTGRGYATEAARALTAAGFEHLSDLEHIEITCDVANVASAAVPRKLGYTLVAEVDRPIETPGHTGRGFVFARARD